MVNPGVYRLLNAKSGTYFDASVRDPGEVHGWGDRPENENQKWIIEPQGGAYVLKNVGNGQYAHVDSGDNGSRVSVSPYPTTWTFEEQGQDLYAIHIVGQPGVIDLDMGRSDNGATINIWAFTGAEQQLWRLQQIGETASVQGRAAYVGAIGPGSYRIQNAASGTAMDLAGGGNNDGAPVIGWSVGTGVNQVWQLEQGINGYRIKNAQSGTYLAFDGPANEGTLLSGQHNVTEWQVKQGNDGYQICLASNPNFVVDLAGGETQDGAKISLWHNGQGKNQNWNLQSA